MASVLEYKKYGLKFYRICPKSSGTIKKQERNYKPLGVSVVAFLEEQQKSKFNQIIDSIEELGYYFRRVQNLHFTLLPLFDDKRKQNPEYLKLTGDTINKFFNQLHKIGPLNIDCNIIRPGSMYDKNKNKIPMLSDGTVIAMSNQESSHTQNLIKIGDDLAKYLQVQLPYIFDPSFGRTYPTIWCTLGYFCHDDFEITNELRHMFEEIASNLKNQSIIIDVDKAQIVKFHKKSLDIYEPLGPPFFL